MTPRIAAEFWVKAHIRICAAQQVIATVVRRGDNQAGNVLIKLNLLDGRASVLEPATDIEGKRVWMRVTGPEPVEEEKADAAIARAIKRDSDVWVLEIEDKAGRHFLSEPVV